jgi:hypothetical protein
MTFIKKQVDEALLGIIIAFTSVKQSNQLCGLKIYLRGTV